MILVTFHFSLNNINEFKKNFLMMKNHCLVLNNIWQISYNEIKKEDFYIQNMN